MSAGTETFRQPGKQSKQLAAIESSPGPGALPGFGVNSGIATLGTGGTVVVSAPWLGINTRIVATANTPGGTQGILSVPGSGRTVATSFTIQSSNSADRSTVDWVAVG